MRRNVNTAGVRDAFVFFLAIVFAISAIVLGSIVYGFVAALLFAILLPSRGRGDHAAAREEVVRLSDTLPKAFRRPLVSGKFVVVGVALASVGGVAGVSLLGAWGGIGGVVIALTPWCLEIMRRYRSERERVANAVLADAPSMTADELAPLLSGLEHRFGATYVRRLRKRLSARR